MRRTKRFLAFALALMMFMSNTVSASATSAGNGLLSGQNTGESTQNVVTVEPTSSEPSSAEPTEPTSEPESSVPETSEVPSSEGTSTEPTTTEDTSVAETTTEEPTTEEATTEEPTTEEDTTEETSEELTAEVSKDATSGAHTTPQDGDIAYVSMDGDYYYFPSIAAAIAYADANGKAGERCTVRQYVGEDTASTQAFVVSDEDLVTENVTITLELSYDLSVTSTGEGNTALSNVNVFNNNSVDERRPTVKVASGTSLQILEGGWHNLNLTFEGDNGTLILGEENKTYTSYPVPVNIDSTTVTGLKNLEVYAPTSWGEIAHDHTLSNATRELDSLVVGIQENLGYGFETSESITAKTVSLDGLLKINNLTVTQSLTAEKTAALWLFGKADIKTLNVNDTLDTDQIFEICRMFLYTDDTFATLSSSASIHLAEIPNSMHKMTIQKRKGYYTSQGLLGYQNNTTPYALGDTIVTVTPGESDTVENFTYMSYYGLELANGAEAYLEPQETDTKGTYDLVLAQDYNEIRLLMFKGESVEPIAEKGFQTFADVKTYIKNKNDGDMKYRILVNEAMSFAGDDLNYADVTAESVGLDMPNKLTATDNAVIAVDDIDGQKYNDEGLIPGTYTDIDLKKKSGMSLGIVPRNGYASVEGIRILSNGSILNLGNVGHEVDSDLYFNASVNGKLALLNCYGNVDMVNTSAVNTTMAMVFTKEFQRAYFANLNADNLTVVDGFARVKKGNIANTLTLGEGRNLTVEPDGSLTVKNVVIAGTEEEAQATILLERMVELAKEDNPEEPSFTGAKELAALGTLKITGNVTLADSDRPILILKNNAWEWTEEGEEAATVYSNSRSTEFSSGEIVANVTNTKIPASDFAIEGENATLERSGANLIAAKAVVNVILYDDEWKSIKEATYTSFEKAVSQLAIDFNSQPGRYVFILLEDAKLNANVTIPTFVKEMHLCSECVDSNETTMYHYERYLDLNGKTLTTSASIDMYEGVRIVSGETGKTASGKIVSNYVGTQDNPCGLAILEQCTLVADNGTVLNDRARVLDNVIVTMKKADISLACFPDIIQNENKDNFGLRASFDVKGFIIQNGSWTLEDISDKNKSYLKTGDLILEAGSYLEVASIAATNGTVVLNSAEVVTDGMTLNKVGLCENGGYIRVNGNVTLSGTTMEVLGELYAKDIVSTTSRIHITEEEELYGFVVVDNLTINSAYAGDAMGECTLDNQTSLLVSNNLTMKAGTLRNEDIVEAGTVNVKDMVNVGSFLCDNFTNTGKLTLEHDSILLINKNGIVNNVVLGSIDTYAEQGNAALGRGTNGSINLKGTFTTPEEDMQLNAFVTDEYKDSVCDFITHEEGTEEEYKEYLCVYITLWDDNNTPDDGSDDHDADYIAVLDPNAIVFTTENKAFPVENINVLPYKLKGADASWREDNANNCVRQSGKNLLVTGNYIHVDVEHAGNQSGAGLKSFATWKDAVNYINSLNNSSARYIISIDSDCDIEGKLELPTKAAHLVIRSGKGDYTEPGNEESWKSEPIALKYQGDIALNTDTTFENIYFAPYAVKNKAKSAAYGSMDTKGKQLELVSSAVVKYSENLIGSDVDLTKEENIYAFNNLKGTKTTQIILVYGADLRVNNMISGIGEIILNNGSKLYAYGGLSVDHIYSENWDENCYDQNAIQVVNSKAVLEVKDTLDMVTPTFVYSEGTMKLNNISSNCDNNILATSVENSITITGDVYSWDPNAVFDKEPWVAVYDKNNANTIVGYRKPVDSDYSDAGKTKFKESLTIANVTKNAIMLVAKSNGDVLANAPKVSSIWFITNAKGLGENCQYDLTHKEGDLIKRGAVEQGNVSLSRIVGLNEEGDRITTPVNDFDTLQEAFTAIDKIGDKDAEYLVTINDVTAKINIGKVEYSKASTASKNGALIDFTLPSKAANVTIRSNEKYTITYKNNLTLKSNLTLENVALRTTNAGTIALSDYTLTLNGVDLEENKLSVTGSAVTKGSKLIVEDAADLVFKKIDKVGALCLSQDASVKSTTTTVVGDLCVDGDQAALIGFGSITITNIAADNTVNIETKPTWTADKKTGNYTKSAPALTILGTVDGNVNVKLLDKENTILSPSDDLVKDLIGKDGIYFAKAANASAYGISISGFEDGYIYKKSGILVYKDKAPQVELKYAVSGDKEVNVVCETYADAISEINTLKTKRDYTITFLASSDSKPANETTVENPVTLTMPNAGTADTLTLTAQNSTEVYFKGDITCNSHVILEDIDFAQVVAQKGINVEVTELDSYPNPVKFKVNGAYTLDINGKVTFNNALALDGSGKAGLTLENGDTLCAVISHTATDKEGLYLEGSIKNFASVNLIGCEAKVLPYATGKKDQDTYKAAEVNVTALNASDVLLTVGDESLWEDKNVKSTFTVKNLNMAGGECAVYGDASLTNVTLTAANNSNPEIAVTGQKFAIAGNVTAASPATFTTAFNNKKQSALTINGDVVLTKPDNKITVDVDVTAGDPFADVDKTKSNALYLGGSYTNTFGKNVTISNTLLTAKKADATAFYAGADALQPGNQDPFAIGGENTKGYILSKTGSDIKVHYAKEVEAALYIGDAVEPYDYYTSFNGAVAVIDAFKNMDAEYTIKILKDVGTAANPQNIKLPSKAAYVKIQSVSGMGIYYKSDLAMGCDTEFENIALYPAGNVGSEKGINVNGHKLILVNIKSNRIGKIVGKGTDVLEIWNDSNSELCISGDVTKFASITLTNTGEYRTPSIVVTGKMITDKLIYSSTTYGEEGYQLKIEGKGSVLGDLINDSNRPSRLRYTELSITGDIVINHPGNYVYVELTCIRNGLKEATLKGAQLKLAPENKLADIKKADISQVVFRGGSGQSLWANGAVYAVPNEAAANAVTVKKVVESSNQTELANCLDLTQASNYINARADQNAEYSISLAENVTDTCLTDSGARSKLTLPSKDKMKKLTVKSGSESDKKTISLTGDVTVSGHVAFENILFDNDKIFSITCEENSDVKEYGLVTPGSGSLTWKNSGIATSGKQIKGIKGKKGGITVTLEASELNMTESITGVAALNLTGNSELTTHKKSDVANVYFNSMEDEWKAFGTTTIGNILGKGTLGTALVKGAPQLTVNYDVPRAVCVKLYENNMPLTTAKDYQNKPLLIAKAVSADRIMAFGYLNDDKNGLQDGIKAYKDSKNYVYNGDISNMEVKLTYQGGCETYAKTYADAINIINNNSNNNGKYMITLLNTSGNKETKGEDKDKTVIKTALAKDGNATYGAFALPKAGKASYLIIKSEDESNPAIIKYTGTLSPLGNMKLKLDNVILTEGTIIKDDKTGDGFNETDSITLNLGTGNVVLGGNLKTRNVESKAEAIIGGDKELYGYGRQYDVVINQITSKTGTLTIDEEKKVLVSGDASITTLVAKYHSRLAGCGKLIAGEVRVDVDFEIICKNVITLGNISGSGSLYIKTAYTAKEWKKATSQLTINGEVSGVGSVSVWPYFYDVETKVYQGLNQDKFQDIMWDGNSKPAAYQKVIQAPKMTLASFTLEYDDEYYSGNQNKFAKMEGGVYFLGDHEPAIGVVGYTSEGNGQSTPCYKGTFFTWDQAVKEIDKLNRTDWAYYIEIYKDLGTDGTLKNLALPTKSKEVRIACNGGGIMMTGTTITLKTDLVLDVPIVAVKKNGKKYYSTAYTINIGKNCLTVNEIDEHYYNGIGTYSPQIKLVGTAAGSAQITMPWTISYRDFITKINGIGTLHFTKLPFAQDVIYSVSEGITGVGTMTIDPGVTVESKDKDVSVKNLVIGDGASVSEGKYEEPSDGEYASLLAKNITVSNTATLASSYVRAGTRTVGDGKVTLNNVIVKDNFNTIEAKQDKNGKSQVQIKGTVSLADPTFCPNWSYITVGLYYNNSISRFAQLSEDMVLLTAPKAAATLFWPSPDMGQIPTVEIEETDDEGNPTGQIVIRETYGLYKSGNDIVYGKFCEVNDETGELVENIEARVWIGGEPGSVPGLAFTTFEAAVKAIDTMALQDVGENGKKTYKSYTIELVKDIEIGNEKGNNKYNTLTLPSKASEVKILGNGHSITFSGNLTLKCNTAFEGIEFLPVKTVKNEAVSAKINLAVGNYKASFKWATFAPIDGAEGFGLGNITGSAKGEVIFEDGFYLEADNVSGINALTFRGTQEQYDHNSNPQNKLDPWDGVLRIKNNLTVKDLRFENLAQTKLYVGGTLTTNTVYLADKCDAYILHYENKPIKVNGTTITENGVKKNVSVMHESLNSVNKVNVVTLSTGSKLAPAGTKVITGKYLNAKDWQMRAAYESQQWGEYVKEGETIYSPWLQYGNYMSGNDLYLGTAESK